MYPLKINLTLHPACVAPSADPERHQPANGCSTTCKTAHVCSDAQACGRVADVDSQIKNPIAIMYVV